MKKTFSVLIVLLFASIFVMDSLAQSFYTGGIGVTLSNFGRVRVFSDNLTTRQVDRSSVLVGVSSSAVFDYTQDAGTVSNAVTVSSPALSDYEVTGTIDNSDSNLPPNVEVKINIYGWNSGPYLLVKMNVKNRESSAINAVIGMEIIDQIDGTYGNETVQYNSANQTVLINRTSWIGYKFFSAPQTSLKSFEWFSGYGTDASYYQWLTQGTFDAPYTAGTEGAVAVMGQNPINIAAGASNDFYFGISYGADQTACLNSMSLCQDKYNLILPVELTSFTGEFIKNKVILNWSTATEINNRGFEVERKADDNNWTMIGFREGKGTTSQKQNYSLVDDVTAVSSKVIKYRLKQIDFNGNYTYSNEIEVNNNSVPDQFILEQNFPNPFNPNTKITFRLPERSNVVLKVFNQLGEEVALLAKGYYSEGTYEYSFDASKLSSGNYIYTLQTDKGIISKKMTLLK